MMTRILLVLTLSFSFVAPSSLIAQSNQQEVATLYGRRITQIEYVGLEAVAQTKAERAIQLRTEGIYTREAETKSLRALFETGLFTGDIRIEPKADPVDEDGVQITIYLKEQPLIEKLTINGANRIREDEIRDTIPFEKGEVLPIDASIQAEEALTALYGLRGFSDVRIDYSEELINDRSAAVSIHINEGGQLILRDIKFEGNDSVSSFFISMRMVSKSSFLIIKNYFDETTWEADLEAIADYYYSLGFLDAEVTDGPTKFSANGKKVTKTVSIAEGERYRVGEIVIEGASIFATEELMVPLEKLIGKHLDRPDLSLALDEVRDMYGDEGWILAAVEPSVQPIEETEAADVRIVVQVDEGQQILVGQIKRTERTLDIPETELGFLSRFFARLAPPVKDEVVLRHIKLQPGEVWRKNRENQSLRELRRLRVFSGVAIEDEPTGESNVRDVNVLTRTGNTGLLLFQAGVGSSDGAFGRVTLTERNLAGEARALSISGTLGSRRAGFAASYLDRDIFESNKKLLVRAFYSDFGRRGYDQTEIGASTTLTTPLAENLDQWVRLRLSNVSIDPDDDVVAELDDYVVAAAALGRELDLRDDVRIPRSGYRLSGYVEGGVADDPFIKLAGSWDWHKVLVADLIYDLEVRGAVLPIPSDRDDLGIGERLFLGGTNDLRGFSFRGAGPKDIGDDDVALGGLTKLLVRNELTFPLGGRSFRGLVFLDAGSLDEDAFALDSPRVGTGFGIRYTTNVVEALFAFGFALADEGDDDTRLVHFAIESGI